MATLIRLSTGRRVAAVALTLVVVAELVALRQLLLLALQRTIRHLLIMDGLKIGSESLERLVVEHLGVGAESAAGLQRRAALLMNPHHLHQQLQPTTFQRFGNDNTVPTMAWRLFQRK